MKKGKKNPLRDSIDSMGPKSNSMDSWKQQLNITGVNQKVLPVLSTETLLHIWLSTEYYGFRPSITAVDTWGTRGLMMSK